MTETRDIPFRDDPSGEGVHVVENEETFWVEHVDTGILGALVKEPTEDAPGQLRVEDPPFPTIAFRFVGRVRTEGEDGEKRMEPETRFVMLPIPLAGKVMLSIFAGLGVGDLESLDAVLDSVREAAHSIHEKGGGAGA